MWSTWEAQILETVIKRHSKVNAQLRAQKKKTDYVIFVMVGDVADQGHAVPYSSTNVLTSVFVRCRHLGCACWLLTQRIELDDSSAAHAIA